MNSDTWIVFPISALSVLQGKDGLLLEKIQSVSGAAVFLANGIIPDTLACRVSGNPEDKAAAIFFINELLKTTYTFVDRNVHHAKHDIANDVAAAAPKMSLSDQGSSPNNLLAKDGNQEQIVTLQSQLQQENQMQQNQLQQSQMQQNQMQQSQLQQQNQIHQSQLQQSQIQQPQLQQAQLQQPQLQQNQVQQPQLRTSVEHSSISVPLSVVSVSSSIPLSVVSVSQMQPQPTVQMSHSPVSHHTMAQAPQSRNGLMAEARDNSSSAHIVSLISSQKHTSKEETKRGRENVNPTSSKVQKKDKFHHDGMFFEMKLRAMSPAEYKLAIKQLHSVIMAIEHKRKLVVDHL